MYAVIFVNSPVPSEYYQFISFYIKYFRIVSTCSVYWKNKIYMVIHFTFICQFYTLCDCVRNFIWFAFVLQKQENLGRSCICYLPVFSEHDCSLLKCMLIIRPLSFHCPKNRTLLLYEDKSSISVLALDLF
jgi:hypothetical protein